MDRRIRRTACGVLLACSLRAFAQESAPLPEFFPAEESRALERGLYAHARSTRINTGTAIEEECRHRSPQFMTQQFDPAKYGTEYWLYKSSKKWALFVREWAAVIDRETCVVTYQGARSVHQETSTGWPPEFGGAGFRCHKGRFESCSTHRRLGVSARCRSHGDGFIGNYWCVSTERGPSHGMSLLRGVETDDLQGSRFEVLDLRPNVMLDARVFAP